MRTGLKEKGIFYTRAIILNGVFLSCSYVVKKLWAVQQVSRFITFNSLSLIYVEFFSKTAVNYSSSLCCQSSFPCTCCYSRQDSDILLHLRQPERGFKTKLQHFSSAPPLPVQADFYTSKNGSLYVLKVWEHVLSLY